MLCLHCLNNLPKTDLHLYQENMIMDVFAGRLLLAKATSFLYFTQTGMVQELLHELKYRNNKELGIYLGKLMGLELENQDWFEGIEAIVPVPLHFKKEYSRGYNQSGLLADGLSEACGKPAWHRLLLRTRNTDSQTKKNRIERWENVKDVFEIGSSKAGVKHILLVDDVLTTGATLEACGRTLMKSYPELKLSVLTLAVAKDL